MISSSESRVSLLRQATLFVNLEARDLTALAATTWDVSLRAGQYLVWQGEAGDSLYVVASGVMEAVLGAGSPNEQIVGTFAAGEVVGEMAILTDEPRSASIRARDAGELIGVSRDAFQTFLAQRPSAALELSRVLSRRLSQTNVQLSRRSGFISVVVCDTLSGNTPSPVHLAAEEIGRRKGGGVVIVPLGGAGGDGDSQRRSDWADTAQPISSNALCAEVDARAVEGIGDADLLTGLQDLRRRYGNVVVVMPPQAVPAYPSVVAAAHRTVVVAVGDGSVGRLSEAANVLTRQSPDIQWAIVGKLRGFEGVWPAQPLRLATQPGLDRLAPEGVDRLARMLTRKVVGLALSGGAAQGLAHLGVMKGLLTAGVPVDIIAGTSGGALYGSLVASGMSLERATDELIRRGRHNLYDQLDPTLPRAGIIRGARIERMIRDMLGGDRHFEELVMPLYAVAADLDTGEEVVLDRGLVHQAVRASISVPGVFEPYALQGRLLVDGGAVDPMPVRVARRAGADLVIGVQVPAPGKATEEAGREVSRRLSRKHNALSTVVRSYYFAGDALASMTAAEADVLIKPPVAHFGWREYRAAAAIIQAGVGAAAGAVGDVERLLSMTPVGLGYFPPATTTHQ